MSTVYVIEIRRRGDYRRDRELIAVATKREARRVVREETDSEREHVRIYRAQLEAVES